MTRTTKPARPVPTIAELVAPGTGDVAPVAGQRGVEVRHRDLTARPVALDVHLRAGPPAVGQRGVEVLHRDLTGDVAPGRP
jgi:hypothetical protein